MKAIITDNLSIAQDIARIVRATNRNDGYITGNGYMVTWALGHLISLAMPEKYDYKHYEASDLPIIPDQPQLVVKQVNTDKGYKPDLAALKQLQVIDFVFSQCESIIVATAPEADGELIFRNIYQYLGYTKPFKRLWLSSLTDEGIRKGLDNLKDGKQYDGLYHSAICRTKADWLVDVNANRALSLSVGRFDNLLGRLQTPVLSMICSRFSENKKFTPAEYWKLHVTIGDFNSYRRFFYTEELRDKAEAVQLYERIKECTQATLTIVKRKRVYQSPPLLYDLTGLQKECNTYFNLSAEKTLKVAQSLYEKKLISYPCTSSRYIPEDVIGIPALLGKIIKMPEFAQYGQGLDFDNLTIGSINNKKITDHHAILTTGLKPIALTDNENKVYTMIAGRMLEAFSPKCRKESFTMEAAIDSLLFRSKSQRIIVPGWRGVFSRTEDMQHDENNANEGMAEFEEGFNANISGCGLVSGKTSPEPLFTEATLLYVMETAGEDKANKNTHKTNKEWGIGTPATRVAIISTLLESGQIERSENHLIPTPKGIVLYDAVKNMRIADSAIPGNWEKTLTKLEKGKYMPETFMQAFGIYIRQVTSEILSIVKK